jgi:hypothetical protein
MKRAAPNLSAVWTAVVLAAAGTGCKDDCSGVYNCPALSDGQLVVPSDLSAPLVSVSADPPCQTYSLPAGAGHSDSGVSLMVRLAGDPLSDYFTCTVHGRLADGTELVAAVAFQHVGCCGYTAVSYTTPFIPVDNGNPTAAIRRPPARL